MGRGPSRKQSDQPRVSIAKTKLPVLEVTIGNGRGAAFTPDQCPVTLQKKIQKSSLTVDNVPVDLKRVGEHYDVLVGGTVIATLNVAQSKIVTSCGELGIRYRGKIVVEKETVYARFYRIA